MTLSEHKARIRATLKALAIAHPSEAVIFKVALAKVAIANKHSTLLRIDKETSDKLTNLAA